MEEITTIHTERFERAFAAGECNNNPSSIDKKLLQKMIFIYNALENGWKVRKKRNNVYVFKKKQNREVFFRGNDDFSAPDLETFIRQNFRTITDAGTSDSIICYSGEHPL